MSGTRGGNLKTDIRGFEYKPTEGRQWNDGQLKRPSDLEVLTEKTFCTTTTTGSMEATFGDLRLDK